MEHFSVRNDGYRLTKVASCTGNSRKIITFAACFKESNTVDPDGLSAFSSC